MQIVLVKSEDIQQRIFGIRTETDFNDAAIAVFRYQCLHNDVYRRFVETLRSDINAVKHYSEIPFLPIEFFKTQTVLCGDASYEACFTSSATTGSQVSRHYVKDLSLYERSFLEAFGRFYGPPQDYCILALLPSYLERSGSSLVYMVDALIRLSGHPKSGFFLHNYDRLAETIHGLDQSRQKTILLGVTYALLDLAEKQVVLHDNFIVMETGGMKGKRKEMIREELYGILEPAFGVPCIHSEYGMTELLSQAYSQQAGLFSCPPWMKVIIRDPNDPFRQLVAGRTGGINVIDLANLHSCAFIATKDLGRLHPNGTFEVAGRFDNSDIRGCNLMAG